MTLNMENVRCVYVHKTSNNMATVRPSIMDKATYPLRDTKIIIIIIIIICGIYIAPFFS